MLSQLCHVANANSHGRKKKKRAKVKTKQNKKTKGKPRDSLITLSGSWEAKPEKLSEGIKTISQHCLF